MNRRQNDKNELHSMFVIECSADYAASLRQATEAAQAVYASLPSRRRLPFYALIGKQLRFYALRLWLLQGAILSVLCVWMLPEYHPAGFSPLSPLSPTLLSFCGAAIALSAAPLLSRPSRCGMLELERSTFFSGCGVFAAQLLFGGVGELCMLAVLIILAANRQTGAANIFLYLVIPFLTAACALLMLLARGEFSRIRRASPSACLLSAWLACMAVRQTSIWCAAVFGNTHLPWLLYALACVWVLYLEGRRLCEKSH